jgi:hypothetical protein
LKKLLEKNLVLENA